jgi:hypothetical protein
MGQTKEELVRAKLRLVVVPGAAAAIAACALIAVPTAGACVTGTCPGLKTPIVTTSPASNVTATSATLSGTVNPNGSTATCTFQYKVQGASASDQQTTPQTVNLVQGQSTTQTVTAALTGLTPGTTFVDQLTCTNGNGAGNGSQVSFTTQPAAGTPSGGGGKPSSLAKLVGRGAFVSRGGVVEVFLGCYGNQACTGTLRLLRSGRAIASRAHYSLGADSGAVVRLHLTRAALKALRRHGHLAARLRASAAKGSFALPAGGARITLQLF